MLIIVGWRCPYRSTNSYTFNSHKSYLFSKEMISIFFLPMPTILGVKKGGNDFHEISPCLPRCVEVYIQSTLQRYSSPFRYRHIYQFYFICKIYWQLIYHKCFWKTHFLFAVYCKLFTNFVLPLHRVLIFIKMFFKMFINYW